MLSLLVQARGYFTKNEFLALCRWKTPRTQPRCAENEEAFVNEVTRTALTSSGLVSIPVQLHAATKDQRIAFHLLHAKCGSRIQNRYHCPVCNVTVERDDRVRGYEFAKDQYVQFTEAELETWKPNPATISN
jgi:Ku70/Ku80 beta-barrel domain